MGLMFLLSGYFTVSSHDRKRSKQFLKDILTRLGSLKVIFAVLIDPPTEYFLAVWRRWFHGSFFAFLSNTNFYTPAGPMWFVLALLFFVFAYLGWRATTQNLPVMATCCEVKCLLL